MCHSPHPACRCVPGARACLDFWTATGWTMRHPSLRQCPPNLNLRLYRRKAYRSASQPAWRWVHLECRLALWRLHRLGRRRHRHDVLLHACASLGRVPLAVGRPFRFFCGLEQDPTKRANAGNQPGSHCPLRRNAGICPLAAAIHVRAGCARTHRTMYPCRQTCPARAENVNDCAKSASQVG